MQMLYNSDSFVVVQFDMPAESGELARGGYEIVDKFARKEIFLQGALADRFAAGVNELVAGASDEAAGVEALDEFISGFTGLAPQPLVVH